MLEGWGGARWRLGSGVEAGGGGEVEAGGGLRRTEGPTRRASFIGPDRSVPAIPPAFAHIHYTGSIAAACRAQTNLSTVTSGHESAGSQ